MNFNNFTIKSQEAVQKAVELARGQSQQAIEPSHLLRGAMEAGESVVSYLFQKSGVNVAMLKSALDRDIASLPRVSGGEPCRKPSIMRRDWATALYRSKPSSWRYCRPSAAHRC